RVEPGLIQHSLGWPLDSRTYGGSFIYHLDNNRAYVGFVVGLDYEDPRLSPFESFQQFKHHPEVQSFLEGAETVPGAPEPSQPAACNRFRALTCRAPIWSATPPAASTSRRSRAFT